MADLIDSKPEFKARTLKYGLSEAQYEALVKKGLDTFASYAFASTWTPGVADDSQFIDKVVLPVLGDKDHVDAPKLRRLAYEAYGLVAGETRARMERSGEELPRKLPVAERQARFEALKRRLPGLELSGPFEPAYCLVDSVASMVEDGALKYLSWRECISREEEVLGVKKAKEWKPDNHGILREVVMLDREGMQADTGTDMKLYIALQRRRGAAMEMGGLLKYEDHQELVRLFLKTLFKKPYSGYVSVTHEQLQRADIEIWQIVSDKTRSGLSPNSRGEHPAALALKEALLDNGVAQLLQCIPVSRHLPSAGSSSDQPPATVKRTPVKKDNLKAKPNPKPVPLPDDLQGTSSLPDGSKICFAYNRKQCKATGRGCTKGRHICTKCHQSHPFRDCPQK